MGTASFSVIQRSGVLPSTRVVASGVLTTTGTAQNAQDSGQDITLNPGQVFQVHVTTGTRINFGSNAATLDTGHFIPLGTQREYQATETGTISLIEV